MKNLFLILVFGVSTAWAAGGDSIRSRAPVTALIYDLRAGNLKALEKAYFEDEISFFLDYRDVQNSAAKELYYLREAGRALARKDVASAQGYIRSVQRYEDEKRYLNGIVEASLGRHAQALKVFEALIDKRRSLPRRLQSLAFMGAARVAHEMGNYSQAIFYYTRIPQLDRQFFHSIYEKSWSFYMDGDMNGALGASLTFMTPYADKVYFPEAPIVRAAAFYHLCMYERANAVIEQMKSSYIPVQAQIRELQKRQVLSWLFDDRIVASMDKRLMAYMIGDSEFRSLQRAYQALNSEVRKLSGSEMATANEALSFVKRRLVEEATRVLEQAAADINRAIEQADTIQIEILQLGVNVLVGAPIEMREDIRSIDLGDVDFSELVQFWPFKGEFWFDELGSYYYGLKSSCS